MEVVNEEVATFDKRMAQLFSYSVEKRRSISFFTVLICDYSGSRPI